MYIRRISEFCEVILVNIGQILWNLTLVETNVLLLSKENINNFETKFLIRTE